MSNGNRTSQPKVEVDLSIAGPVEVDGKNEVSGIARATRGSFVLANEDVIFYLDGVPDSVVETTDEAGQCAKKLAVAGYGGHVLQAFFPGLQKWTRPRGFALKKPEVKKAKEENLSLDVWPVRNDQGYLVNVTPNVTETEITKLSADKEKVEEVTHPTHKVYDVLFYDPRNAKPKTVKTVHGIATALIPFPDSEPITVMVRAGGQAEAVILEPKNFTNPNMKERK